MNATGDNEIIVYQPDTTLTLDVRVKNETVWLNRNQIATLFDKDVKTRGKHIKGPYHKISGPLGSLVWR
ncbi:MAG: hypothetical protein NC343_01020, partial [Muribaculum sp.]|nr:hypothetical protein [Muribaculaceae bacterium]MCM1080317.1 hypothetical protein [Muribaculum sp.]